MTHFLQFEQNIYVRLKDLIEFFPKMVWLIGFGVTVREIFRVEISKKLLSQKKEISKPFLSRADVLLIVAENPVTLSIF